MEKITGKTKYRMLMEDLKGDILSGKIKSGEMLPSENQLSMRYHISRHTVRRAIGILTNEGYVVAEHGKGTFCSTTLPSPQKSGNIVVVTPYLSDYNFPRLIQGMDQVLSANGYSILLKNTGNSRKKEAAVLEEILGKEVDGLIIEPSKSQLICQHTQLYDALEEQGIPYVFIQGIHEQMEGKPCVLLDDFRGGYLVTKHLVNLGHRHILGIFKADDVQGKERHKGYVKALQEGGILYDPDMVIWFRTEDRRKKPAAVLERILDRSMPVDGIVCYNDQIALDVCRKLKELGIQIPRDISVTGYDNSMYARGERKLTTIAHPQERLGEMAAQLLLDLIHGISPQESKVEQLSQPWLIRGDSCMQRNYKI